MIKNSKQTRAEYVKVIKKNIILELIMFGQSIICTVHIRKKYLTFYVHNLILYYYNIYRHELINIYRVNFKRYMRVPIGEMSCSEMTFRKT